MTITLRPYQRDGLNSIWNYFQNGNTGNPLLCWPTGTGKSIVPAIFIKSVMDVWPTQRFLMVTHVKELIEQNHEVLKTVWNNAPVGIYSAGLKQKDSALPIIYGGIQSMIKNPVIFGRRDIAFVDEAHLISLDDASMYNTFFATMKLLNPYIKIIGMTATPFRMGQGMIIDPAIGEDGKDKRLFTDIAHDVTGLHEFNQLIADGYLAPLIPAPVKTALDVSNVGIQKGEFIASQLQKAVDREEITLAGLREVIEHGEHRRSWLIFASGIEHAEHIAAMLTSFGIDCAAVHSKKQSEYNDAAIKAFKSFELRSIVNFGKLTTGFNHPGIDLIAMFRPTLSVPLWVQMLGRGTRPVYAPGYDLDTVEGRLSSIIASSKQDCLVLDFARNTPRLGPINDPLIPRKKGEKGGEAPMKICDGCGAYNHAAARFCWSCGEGFEFKVKIVAKAGTEELLRSDQPVIETFEVTYPIYARGQKKDKVTGELGKPYIKVTYFCGMQSFNEFVFPEGTGIMRLKFTSWWKQRHPGEPPKSTDEALQYISQLRPPRTISVHLNKKYPEVLSAEY